MALNYAVIFGGGVGARMNSQALPKQFLEVDDKPIIIHTLERFDSHAEIDGIVVACLEAWCDRLEEMVAEFGLKKVVSIVPGGASGQLSIFEGLKEVRRVTAAHEVTVLVHDAVRPLISAQLITDNLRSVEAFGSAITTAPATETVLLGASGGVASAVTDRPSTRFARAPQSFRLDDLLEAHHMAMSDGVYDVVDSCTMMLRAFGGELHLVDGPSTNIKVTTPEDLFVLQAVRASLSRPASATEISGLSNA